MRIERIKEYGAIGDGIRKDTEAVQKAIDDCAEAGGGRVVLEDGVFLCGTLYFRSHVYLEIRESAVLKASPDIADYGTDTHRNRYRNEPELDRCFLYAEDAEQIGLIGYGQIQGNAEAFPNEGSIYRPMMMRFLRCKNIRISDLGLYDAAAWTTAFLDSEDIWIRGVDIRNEKRYNGDGLDFDGCRRVFVSDCRIRGTDDNLCLQSSSREYPTRDIHIMNCTFSSVCAGIRIGLKSIGEISHVVIANCTMDRIWREGVKIECTEGGTISDILIQNISMRNVRRPLFLLLNNRFEPEDLGSSLELEEMPEIGELKRIQISHVTAADEEEMRKTQYRFGQDIMGRPEFGGIRVDAEAHHPIRELTLSDISYTAVGGVKKADIPQDYPTVPDRRKDTERRGSENYWPDWSRSVHLDIRNVDGLKMEGIRLETLYADERESVIVEGCRRV